VTRKAKEDDHVFRVSFLSQGNVYEVYAKHVSQGNLFGFLEVEQVLFEERSKVVIDPSEDRLRNEFEGVRRFYVPIHSILRVDEVERQGTPRISSAGAAGEASKLSLFPMPFVPPKGSGRG
jgi:hypothetical protein